MTYWSYDNFRMGFIIRAKEDIKSGQEIFISYGNRSNSVLFLYYGFVIENNENDDVMLGFTKYRKNPLNDLKIELFGPKYSNHMYSVSRYPDDSKFQNFISYLRFLTYKSDPTQVF